MFKPMFFATAVFLIFYPANAMWLSVREAAGELKFNNLLLFITNYLIGLPIIAYILTHVTGKIIYVEKSGLQFAVVSHSITFAYVIITNSCLEAVRAFLSRIHIFKFNWIEKSHLRLTRSLLDMEVEIFKGGSFTKGFSEDLTELIDDKFIRAGVEGAVSFPFWLNKLSGLIKNKKDFAVISLMPDHKISTVWRNAGEGYARLAEAIGKKGLICRMSRYYVVVLLPNADKNDCKNILVQIHSEIGVYLSNCYYAHLSDKTFDSLSTVIKWLATPQKYEMGFVENEEWLKIASQIFLLSGLKTNSPVDKPDKLPITFDKICRLIAEHKNTNVSGVQFREFCQNEYRNLMKKCLRKKVVWLDLRNRGFSDDENFVSDEMWRLMSYEEKRTSETGIPDYRKFSKKEWRGFIPVFFFGTLTGFLKFDAQNIDEQKEMILISAATYLYHSILMF